MEPTPDDILARAREGDRLALDALFRLHADAILTHARFKIGPRWSSSLTPEDVLQTTCIDVVRSIGSFEPKGEHSLLHWMKRIAENNILDAISGLQAESRRIPRRQNTLRGASDDASITLLDTLIPAWHSNTPSQAMRHDDARRAVESALALLPDEHRRIVVWYDLEGRSIASIAEELGKSPGAAYMMRTRAHERLREILEKRLPQLLTNP